MRAPDNLAGAPGSDVAVSEDQVENQHDQQQAPDPDSAAIPVAGISPPAAAQQQNQQYNQKDQAHIPAPFETSLINHRRDLSVPFIDKKRKPDEL
jgi:hypothetical protein